MSRIPFIRAMRYFPDWRSRPARVADGGSSGEFLDLLAKAKKRQDEQDDDDEADEVNDAVHVISPGRG